jgi:NADP-dependent 3-hydroxy acid dehydrogenase YdfG
MSFEQLKVFISGAYREFGRTLATHFADKGAELFLTVRSEKAQRETIDFFQSRYSQRIHVYDCDLTNPQIVSATIKKIAKETDYMDIIVNNAAMWLEGSMNDVSDEDVVNTVNSGITGNLLVIKNLEKLLLNSKNPEIVNMISACAIPHFKGSSAHEAFYAMKHGQSALSQILTERLKSKGVRVISLYPPDFHNIGENPELWNTPEKAKFGTRLTSRELVDTINFALTRPRSCMMNQIFFEDTRH